jgi:broad specificity phosphatase PhoE
LATKIFLVRHGETDWNREKRIQGGSSDTPLNAAGMRQAENLAAYLADENITAVYSSPLSRGLNTAKAIANPHKLEVITEADLREIEAGDLEGITLAELGTNFSEMLTRENANGGLPTVPGGESLPDVQRRGWQTARRIAADHPDTMVVVVSHYFVILAIVCAVLDLPLARLSRLSVRPVSISAISIDGEKSRLELLNQAAGTADCL